jgi:hypothetical protein
MTNMVMLRDYVVISCRHGDFNTTAQCDDLVRLTEIALLPGFEPNRNNYPPPYEPCSSERSLLPPGVPIAPLCTWVRCSGTPTGIKLKNSLSELSTIGGSRPNLG